MSNNGFSIEKESVKFCYLKWFTHDGRCHCSKFRNVEDAIKYYKDYIYGARGVDSHSLEVVFNCHIYREVKEVEQYE